VSTREGPAERLIDAAARIRHLHGERRTLLARAGLLRERLRGLDEQVAELTATLCSLGARRNDLGDFDRIAPFSAFWGADRGRCVDRYYIESFLARHADDIRGDVLEVHDADYTRRFGNTKVQSSSVLDIDPGNRAATIVGDLQRLDAIPDGRFDCVILTQTLQFIPDVPAALSECRRLLRPGGTLLATLPSASRVSPEQGPDGDYWRFTAAAARIVFSRAFGPCTVTVESFGNVLVGVASLFGLACEDLEPSDFAHDDPYFPLVVGVRVQLDRVTTG
jgi:hypothetical protein